MLNYSCDIASEKHARNGADYTGSTACHLHRRNYLCSGIYDDF